MYSSLHEIIFKIIILSEMKKKKTIQRFQSWNYCKYVNNSYIDFPLLHLVTVVNTFTPELQC